MRKKRPTIFYLMVLMVILVFILCSCAAPRITIFPDTRAPLREFTLEGTGEQKILLINLYGILSDQPQSGFLRSKPSVVQEIVSHLRYAEKDDGIKAILLKIDSPGGTTTASDILYNEIKEYKRRTNTKIISIMMNMSTSGGYYVSLPSDQIMAHPTSITGSVGVIFIRPGVSELFRKIGINVDVNKSGENKDMMSPFRKPTEAENQIIQDLSEKLGNRFLDLVRKHRQLDAEKMKDIASARVFLADDAKAMGLIDEIGYLSDAVKSVKKLAGLTENAKVVVYRRSEHNNDNVYNTSTSQVNKQLTSNDFTRIGELLRSIHAGFYYIWPGVISGL